jgi:integrase
MGASCWHKKKNNIHCARHTFATLQLKLERFITIIKAISPTDIKTTQIYGTLM